MGQAAALQATIHEGLMSGSLSFPHHILHSLCLIYRSSWAQHYLGSAQRRFSLSFISGAGQCWISLDGCPYLWLCTSLSAVLQEERKAQTQAHCVHPPRLQAQKSLQPHISSTHSSLPRIQREGGSSRVWAHLCCHPWGRVTHTFGHILTAWEALFPSDLAECFPQTLLCWLRCCWVFPQLSSAIEERHQCQCWKIHPHTLCCSLAGILGPERPILIIKPDLPDKPKFTPGFLHQRQGLAAELSVWKGHWTSVQKAPYPFLGNLAQWFKHCHFPKVHFVSIWIHLTYTLQPNPSYLQILQCNFYSVASFPAITNEPIVLAVMDHPCLSKRGNEKAFWLTKDELGIAGCPCQVQGHWYLKQWEM